MLAAEREKLKKELAKHKSSEEILAENQRKIEVPKACLLTLLRNYIRPSSFHRGGFVYCSLIIYTFSD